MNGYAHLVAEWHQQWPMPACALALIFVFLGLRFAIPEAERGRVRAGLFFAGAYLAMLPLDAALVTPRLEKLEHPLRIASTLVFAFAVVVASGILLFDLLLRRRPIPRIMRDLLHGVIYFLTTFAILNRAGVDITHLFTASVVTTAVIGLALQETLGNVMAGLALQFEREFQIGDWIRIDDKLTGRVREVRWRATSLLTKNGDLILVPNSSVARAVLTNFSRPALSHRRWVSIKLHGSHPPSTVRDLMTRAAHQTPGVLKDPEPDTLLMEFRDDSVLYACRFWIDDFQRDDPIDSDVRSAIWYALRRAGIELPSSSMDVNLTEMTDERVQRNVQQEHARRIDALSRVDIFRPLDAQTLDRLAHRLHFAIYAPGENVIRQHEPGDSLYVVRAGEVSVLVERDGARRQVASLQAGDFFGEMSLMTGEMRSATVVTRTNVECYVLGKDAFREVLVETPKLAEDISAILAERQRELGGVSAEAAATRAVTSKNQVLSRIAAFFGLR